MRHISLILLVSTLAACTDGGGAGISEDTDGIVIDTDGNTDTDDTGDTDDGDVPPLDQDDDGDGFSENDGDCDDGQPAINPEATDLVGDGIDQNCDDADGFDSDGDGHADSVSGGDDCDDSDPFTFPGAIEVWYDGIDQGCLGDDWEGDNDQDGDGYDAEVVGGDDCLDTNANVHVDAAEFNDNGLDDNCNDLTDQFALTAVWSNGDPALTLSVTDVSATLNGNVGPQFEILDSDGTRENVSFDDFTVDTTATVEVEDGILPWTGPAADQTYMLTLATDPTTCWAWGYAPESLDPDGNCLREDPTSF